jgi:hypothetical protein
VARRRSTGTDGALPATGDTPSARGASASSAPGGGLEGALDALYAAPFDRFVAERREATVRLRAAGDVAAARSIANAAKPTRTAWALNQVARDQPELVTNIVKAREAAATAQKSGDANAIREGARAFRDAVGEVVRAARSVLDEAGAPLNAAQARRMAETLQALATDDAERQKLVAGRLTQDVAVEDPFAGLEPGAQRERPATPPSHDAAPNDVPEAGARAPLAAPLRKRAEAAELRAQRAAEDAARKREAEERAAREKQRAIEEARAGLEAAERAADDAREVAAVAERALVRAREEADGARRALTKAETDLEHARARAKRLGA